MSFNLYGCPLRRVAAVAALLLFPISLPAQSPCPALSGPVSDSAWTAYRAGDLARAERGFTRALALCTDNIDARVGLGFLALRDGRTAAADSFFTGVVRRDTANADGWEGLARAAFRLGDTERARAAAHRAVALAPKSGARDVLDRLDPDWDRPPLTRPTRPAQLQLVSRVRGEEFEVRAPAGWQPIHLQGVNLGVALPGRFPSEFPTDSARYAGWLDTIAAMHANTVRVYTILPPTFYRALRGWNLAHPDRSLWLLHGVWTELPPAHDRFDDSAFVAEFRAEMRRVVDLVHGNAEIPVRPGHAAGRYDADVSRWTVGYIIGREWEPYAVSGYEARHPDSTRYRGRFLETDAAPAMDVWMAEQCDYLLAYEVDRYNALRPIAYTNWPTLDPLTHPTESTAAEERRFRNEAEPATHPDTPSHEEDVVALDANLVRPTAANPAGWFASYHIYPYYPDFLIYDPDYARARSSEGPSNYAGYLQDLRRHHAGLPLLVAEYGVPSSRDVAHRHPGGWDHGGHDELAMAAIDARLAREIRESGAAGGIVFAWIDEWFKKNWVVANFETPAEHDPRWHNVMDPEENYGILGQYSGTATRPVPGGEAARWVTGEPIDRRTGGLRYSPEAVHLQADAAYLYVAVPLAGAQGKELPWDSIDVQIALDLYDPALGQRRLPGSEIRSEIGLEFLIDLRAPDDAEVRIVPDYNPYVGAGALVNGDDFNRFYRHPATIVPRDDGRFDSLYVITNRARYGRDGTFFPSLGYNRGRLRYAAGPRSTLADWYYDREAGLLELRLPWGLLNVTDPSTATILFERPGAPAYTTTRTPGIRLGVVTLRGGRIVGALPAVGRDGRWKADGFTTWQWPEWVEPVSHARLKPVYDSLKAVWGAYER